MEDLCDIDFVGVSVTEHFSNGRTRKGRVFFAGLQGSNFYLNWKPECGTQEEVVLEPTVWFGTINYDGIVLIDRYYKPSEKFLHFWVRAVTYTFVLDR